MEDVDWSEEERVRAWLTDEVFVEKDRLLDLYYQGTGVCVGVVKQKSGGGGVQDEGKRDLKRHAGASERRRDMSSAD